MAEKVLMKGNEALAEAAIQAGCHHFFGYPITPQTELAAYMAKRMPKIGGTYLQAESEIAAVNMVLGAAAAGVREVLLTAGCAGAWSPRALRAGMGAHFVLHIHERVDAVHALGAFRGAILATALGEGARSLYELNLDAPVAWLFGAEGQGVSPALLACASQRVIIPMAGDIESLNVAAAVAVCLFEQVRQCEREK